MGTAFIKDGFELSDDPTFSFAKWDGTSVRAVANSISYSPLNKHHGAYCMKATVDNGQSGNNGYACAGYGLAGGVGVPIVHMRCYCMLDQLPPASGPFYFMGVGIGQYTPDLYGAFSAVAMYYYNNAGTLEFRYRYHAGAVFVQVTCNTGVSLNKQYCVELAASGTAAVGWVNCWIDGVKVGSSTGLTIDREFLEVFAGASFSSANATSDTSVYIDCFECNTTRIFCERPTWSMRNNTSLRTKRSASGRVGGLYLK